MSSAPASPPASLVSLAERWAGGVEAAGRWVLFLIGVSLVGVVPWLMGGNSLEGSRWVQGTVLAGAVPFVLWLTGCALRRRCPGASFWVALVCWGLLGVQVWLSLKTLSAEFIPFVQPIDFRALPHREHWPSTAFWQSTQANMKLWLAYAVLAVAARHLGLGRRALRALLILLVVNAAVLAVVGLPYKFSGEKLLLGRYPMQEWYFYSSFIYHNHWAAFALLALGATAALFFSTTNALWQWVLALVAGLLFASTVIATARLGTLMLGAFGLAALVAAWRRQAFSPKMRRAWLVGGLAGLLLFGGGVAALLKSGGGAGGHRTFTKVLTTNPFTSRIHLVEDSWRMIRDKPAFGWGLGAFMGGFRLYQRPETRIVHNNNRITLYNHPHNDWIERLAELGFVGFALFLLPGGYWAVQAARRRPRVPLAFWPAAAFGVLFVMAWGDSIFVNMCVAATTVLLLPALFHELADAPDAGEKKSTGKAHPSV